MRRVVVGVNAEGRSHVVSDDEIGDLGMIWETDPSTGVIPAVDATTAAVAVEPPAGGTRWLMAAFPPAAEQAAMEMPPGIDEHGFHTTRTVDYAYFLDGTVMLDLDEESTEIGAGDCVVILAARHAWRNTTDRPVRLLGAMTSLV